MNFFEERDDELINVQLLSDAEQTEAVQWKMFKAKLKKIDSLFVQGNTNLNNDTADVSAEF